ncbi:hypothetical protein AGLY_014913 [Aphis glycines]|uniref:Uncharacterized protein n=1 Tax=Aphis glycines TaxID=307491 RepID=A0A6G0T2J9_APHGL|nr:hypothetical protein AGLY_014913 [Aphis glycines]
MLQKSIKGIRRKYFVPSKYSFLYSEHFLDSDYQSRVGSTTKLLNENAIPLVFKGFPVHLQKSLPVKQRILQSNIPDIVKSDDKCIQCVIISPTKEKLRPRIHVLQKKLNRRDLKIKNFKTLLDGIKRNISDGFTLNLLLHERKCKTLEKQGVRYTNTIKHFSKTLYFYFPK